MKGPSSPQGRCAVPAMAIGLLEEEEGVFMKLCWIFIVMVTLSACTTIVEEPAIDAISGAHGSAYTDFDLDDCTLVEIFEEGGGAEFQCLGYLEIPVYVTEGDLRFDIDVGAKNDRFDTPPAFNTLGDKMEWRMKDWEPFAVIVRYLLDDGLEEGGMPDGASWLAVIKIGAPGAPGCTAGYINALAYRNANEIAREWADKNVEAFQCSDDAGVDMIETAVM